MKKRSNFSVCMNLIKLVKPLTLIMILAIIMGILGHLCATFIPVLGAAALLQILGITKDIATYSLTIIFVIALILGLLRGILHCGEQACNHYIAFKLLALIRDKVFGALRRLCPAKLEGKDRGNLISLITSDIELLEVFYAHTISPIAISALMAIIMFFFLGSFHWIYAVIGISSDIIIGIIVPLTTSKKSKGLGDSSRSQAGELSSFVLDSLRGLPEIIQYDQGANRLEEINKKGEKLSETEKKLKGKAGTASAITTTVIITLDLLIIFAGIILYLKGTVNFYGLIIPVFALMSSFGPVIALSNLGSGLQNTFAAGNRVLDILEEEPITEDVTGHQHTTFHGASVENLSFTYDKEKILTDLFAEFPENSVIGIKGKSGSGKSTLLKLLMRFWQPDNGAIRISNRDIENINTTDLRNMESYVTQETYLFHDTIANNLRVANPEATDEELKEACKKAAVHDFIETLPQGYDTQVGELGSTLSGGERQRLGLARTFLHKAPLILLDEPTSNLDSLNEAVILKTIDQERQDKTIILVSHRASTMAIADNVYNIENGRLS